MRRLDDVAGFPLAIDPQTYRLISTAVLPEPEVRSLGAMRPVLHTPECSGPAELYWMYRRAGPSEVQRRLRARGLRFDLTVLRPGTLAGEFIKTFGHVHPPAADGWPYPELYQVLAGRAWFLLQREASSQDDSAGRVEVRLIAAEAGDCALVPPGFGHVTINVGNEPLVLANWVADAFASDYEPFRRRRGAAVYVLAAPEGDSGGEPHVVPNPHYPVPPVVERVAPPSLAALGLGYDREPIFAAACRQPDAFVFLVEPSQRPDLF